MVSKFVKLALISFLSITVLLGAHQFRMRSHDQQMIAQSESWEAAKQGSPTFFETNPFGMPGADARLRSQDNMNAHAAAYGLTPPTSLKTQTFNAQAVNGAQNKAWNGWNYLGLLGLLGLLGFSKRSVSHSE